MRADGNNAAALLACVRGLLAEHRAELSSAAAATTEEIAVELARSRPDRGRVRRLLAGLARLVSSVEPLADAVRALSAAIT